MDPRYTPLWRVQQIPQPAAGAEFTITPVNAAGWLVRTLRVRFVADANVANRQLRLNFTNGTNIWGTVNGGNVAAAGATLVSHAHPGQNFATAATGKGPIDWPVDGVWLPQGHSIVSDTENIQAGDQYSQIVISVIEYPSGSGLVMWPFPPAYTEESS